MKIRAMIALTIVMMLVFSTTVYAVTSDYSERIKETGKETGSGEESGWEEINRRQIERRNRINKKKKISASENISKPVLGQSEGYGSKNSYDEFHTVPRDINANDNYRSGRIDELHINENYKQDVWHPEDRGMRINGFDEFHFPDEM